MLQMPAPMPECPHRLDPAAADPGREDLPKAPPPETHRLMRDVDPTLVQQALEIPQRHRLEHYPIWLNQIGCSILLFCRIIWSKNRYPLLGMMLQSIFSKKWIQVLRKTIR